MKVRLAPLMLGLSMAASLNVAGAQPPGAVTVADEIIVKSSGEAVAPWAFGSACTDGGAKCGRTLINQETGEIAMIKGELAGAFVRVDKGVQIQRRGSLTTKPRVEVQVERAASDRG